LTESGSLRLSKWLIALSGTGVETSELLVLLPPPPPEAALEDAERVVPLAEVFALEEMLLEELVFVSTVEFARAVEAGESAEVELTLDRADVVLVLAGASGEVEYAEGETPVLNDGVNSALPGEAAAPEPAPDEEPAVFDVGVVEDELPLDD
jgi:hypothetical protein